MGASAGMGLKERPGRGRVLIYFGYIYPSIYAAVYFGT